MRENLLKRIRDLVPLLNWMPRYSTADFKGDVSAGITVGVMLIPQGMAYAVLAGMPPIYGLYASLVPLLIYPFLGTSRQLSIGVVAIDMLIVAAGVGSITEVGSGEYISLVVLLTFCVGITQIAMSAARLGFIVNILSRPVVAGFTTAAPLIISFSQLNNLLGVPLPNTQYIYEIISNLTGKWDEVHIITLIIGVSCILLLLIMRKWMPLFPEALVVAGASTLLVWGLDLQKYGVEIIGKVPSGLPVPQAPNLNVGDIRTLFPTIVTLALVQFMYVVSVGRVFAHKNDYTIHPNQELFAIGSANLIGSFFRGMPVSGSFSRTAVSDQAGSRTAVSNMIAAVLIGLTLLFFTPLFYYMPLAALGAIIVVAALGLIDIEELKYLFTTKERDGWLAVFTFVITLAVGIQEGILLGVGASLIAVLFRASRPNVAVLGYIPGYQDFRDISRFPEAQQIEGILVLRVDASFSFTNAEYFKDFILEKSEKEDRTIHTVIIDGMSINDLDTTAVDALKSVLESLEEMDIDIYMTGLKGPVRDVMYRSGLADILGEDHFYMSPHRAVKHVISSRGEEELGSDLESHRDENY